MNNDKNNKESFKEIKIIRPKVVRLCPSRKIKKSSSSSSTSSSNSERCQNQLNINDSKNILTNLDNISIEEINNDFFNYKNILEEEQCQNELLDILNNDTDSDNENITKIKRCKNPYKNNLELLKDSDFNNLINEFNDLYSNQKKLE